MWGREEEVDLKRLCRVTGLVSEFKDAEELTSGVAMLLCVFSDSPQPCFSVGARVSHRLAA